MPCTVSTPRWARANNQNGRQALYISSAGQCYVGNMLHSYTHLDIYKSRKACLWRQWISKGISLSGGSHVWNVCIQCRIHNTQYTHSSSDVLDTVEEYYVLCFMRYSKTICHHCHPFRSSPAAHDTQIASSQQRLGRGTLFRNIWSFDVWTERI